ncbi:MAG: RecX family transcriptional regulator [Eubacteriales bacterium]|nr:RecX family transcriptional regulator [Eubacteriales bacterium]
MGERDLSQAKSNMDSFLHAHQDLLLDARRGQQSELETAVQSSSDKPLNASTPDQLTDAEARLAKIERVRNKLASQAIYQEARARGIAYLSRVTQSTGKFREKMLELEFPPKLVEFLIIEFSEEGFLDDEAICELIMDAHRDRRSESCYAMRRRLTGRGIPAKIASRLVERDYAPDQDRIEEMVEALYGVTIDAILDEEKRDLEVEAELSRKIIQRASSRGFSPSEVVQYLRQRGLSCKY